MSNAQVWAVGQAAIGLVVLIAAAWTGRWGLAALAAFGIALALLMLRRRAID